MSPKKRNQLIIIGGIVVIAVIAVIVVIAMSGQTTSSSVDFAAIPQSRTEDGAYVLGNPDAPITLIEFSDYACPHCQEYRHTIDRFIQEQVATGKAKFEFRLFPTTGGALTEFAGRVGECAENQTAGSFWRAYDLFYQLAESGQYSDQMGRIVTERLGLDYSQILNCTSNADPTAANMTLGRQLGVSGTPAVAVRYGDSAPQFINFGGQTYSAGGAPYDVLAQVVAAVQ
jgi:protein-disulfide isomerase